MATKFSRRAGMAGRMAHGHLTAAGRHALPGSAFALPSERYPIHDKAHARAALSRGAANATPAELAMIKRKVKARYPGMVVS